MNVQQSIEADLQQALAPQYLAVLNESHMHNVPEGSESHFKVLLVCDSFEGLRVVARHQRVYETLRRQLSEGVHALALHTYTPQEWRDRNGQAPGSPDCMGGSGQ